MESKFRGIFIFYIILFIVINGFGQNNKALFKSEYSLDSLKISWDKYNELGYYDSLIHVTRPFMKDAIAKSDTYAVVYSGLYVAQAFMFKEKVDSVNKYLNIVSDYSFVLDDPKVNAIVNNVLGIYQLKMKLDYSEALSFFQKSYNYVRELKEPENEVVLLANIVYIFYIRNDRNGMVYARQAFDVMKNNELDDFTKTIPYVLMAQMYYVDGNYKDASYFVSIASDMAKKYRLLSLIPTVELLQGDLYVLEANEVGNAKADSCYRCALTHRYQAMPGLQALICLNYGNLCKSRGDFNMALSLYKDGLSVCRNSGNIECREDLLKEISDVYYLENKLDSSLLYYRAFHACVDSIDNVSREQDLNRFLMSYQEMEHQNLMQAKELDLLRVRRKIMSIAFVLIVMSMVALTLIILFRRQRKMYRLLVLQHQKFLQRINCTNESRITESVQEDEDNVEEIQKKVFFKELYAKMDNLMRTEKMYCLHDISLEKVAELMNTNRTYISKAVNMCTGMSFHKYVNMLRIADATMVLSDPRNEKPLKQLADELGFSSVSVFYKTFQRETGCTANIYRKTVQKGVPNSCDDT